MKRLYVVLPSDKLSAKIFRDKLFSPYQVFYWMILCPKKNCHHVKNLSQTLFRPRYVWRKMQNTVVLFILTYKIHLYEIR